MAVSTAGRVRPNKKRSPWKRRLKIAFALFFLMTLVLFIVGGLIWSGELSKAQERIPKLEALLGQYSNQPSVIVSADGQTLFTIASEYRRPIKDLRKEVPETILNATIAAEDKRFFEHEGIDTMAIMRVLFTNAKEGRMAQGGSTLTMQLAKRLYSDGSRTFQRKLEDMAMAVQMERVLSKDEILRLYLNQVYYGRKAYGIQAAADIYFGKKLDDLTVGEAAMLARCVRRPSHENPVDNPKKAIENRDVVLSIMRSEKMISEEEYEQALKEPLKVRKTQVRAVAGVKVAPYFVDYVLDVLHEDFPNIDLGAGGYRVETTLNLKMQTKAEEEVRKLVRNNRSRRVTTAAFVLMTRTGEIKAMVGGVDYKRNQYNVITQGRRQPGSAWKPFVYASAFESGRLSPRDSLSNAQYVFRDPYTGYTKAFKNASGRYGGQVSIRTAISQSLNMPALRAMERAGPATMVNYAHRAFGFTSQLDPVIALALGAGAVSPLEMAQGYSVFALEGDRATPYGIRRIVGPDGSVVREFRPDIKVNVISKSTAEAISSFLRAVVTSGTGRIARSVNNARGKTGTTSENRDAWFCGYTDELIGIGWIANERPNPKGSPQWVYEPMSRSAFGGTVTITMWQPIMAYAQKLIGEKPRRIEEKSYGGGDSIPAGIRSDDTGDEVPAPGDVPANPDDATPTTPDGAPAGPQRPAENGGGGADGVRPDEERGGDVMVEICADSGARATRYCPETVVRPFRRGTQPRRPCSIHGP